LHCSGSAAHAGYGFSLANRVEEIFATLAALTRSACTQPGGSPSETIQKQNSTVGKNSRKI
jgi:hypothetical protein